MQKQKFWQTEKFNEEKEIWDQKLKDEGFNDIETTSNGERVLKQSAYKVMHNTNSFNAFMKASYYQILSAHVSRFNFELKLDHLIMTLRADGISIAEICRRVKKTGMSVHRDTARCIIRRYEHNWGIRTWAVKQRWPKRAIK